jgi:hypothetical protein
VDDPLGMQAYQEQLVNQAFEDMQRDHFLGEGMFATNPPPYIATQSPQPSRLEEPPLLDDQEEAYHYLLDTLTPAQRDALLVLSMDSPANALDQVLRALWRSYRRDQRG